MNLENKNVIYVGGFGGIGFASCKHFLQNKVKVCGYLFYKYVPYIRNPFNPNRI